MHDNYCRIEQIGAALTVNCFPLLGIDGTISTESAHFHLAWGTMMARIVVDGTMQSAAQFAGHFTVKVSGISFDDPDISEGTKLTLSTATPDKGGKTSLLAHALAEMASGSSTEPFDEKSNFVQRLKPEMLRPLGGVQTIIYLGESQKETGARVAGAPVVADFFSVY